ncbi:MAG: TIGR04063 family PEP-CTERM/XrtA system glycosyltransferase [Candidatus Binatia bacterium]
MPPTRVLHVLDHSLPHLSGYSVRSHYLLQSQQRLSLDPIGLTSPKHGTDGERAEIDGINYLRTPHAKRGVTVPGLGELQLMQRLAVRVGQVVREEGVQIVHAHSPVLNGIPALWAARRARIPIVYEIRAFWEDAAVDHGTHQEDSLRYQLVRRLETWLSRRVDAVGVISEGLAAELMRRGIPSAKIFRIPNGVDTELFQPMVRDPALVERWGLQGKTVIGFIGSFYRYEGIDILLEAWAKIATAVPFACLLLIGAGEAAPALRVRAQELGIAESTIFAGTVPHIEIPRCYSVCDVLAYPRKSMRLTELVTPLKPLEAMAAGKAVIASDVGGLRELIRDGETGKLFAAGDVDALAQVLKELVGDPDLRSILGGNARRHVCKERQWSKLVRAHVDTYARLLNGTSGSRHAA